MNARKRATAARTAASVAAAERSAWMADPDRAVPGQKIARSLLRLTMSQPWSTHSMNCAFLLAVISAASSASRRRSTRSPAPSSLSPRSGCISAALFRIVAPATDSEFRQRRQTITAECFASAQPRTSCSDARVVLVQPGFGQCLVAALQVQAQIDRLGAVDGQVELRAPVAGDAIRHRFGEHV